MQQNAIQIIHLTDIQPDPNQPRKEFGEEKISELADNIKRVGLIQPITVRPTPEGPKKYMIIAGERRYQATRRNNEKVIKCIIDSEINDDALFAQQLSENLNRQDLNPVEKAEFINNRIEYLKSIGDKKPKATVAEELGVSSSWISKNTSILKYSLDVREVAIKGFVRNYATLKDLDALEGDERELALSQLKKGTFDAKYFFSEERKKEIKQEQAERSEQSNLEKKATPKKTKIALTKKQVIKLISKTDYRYILDKHNEEWASSEEDVIFDYLKKFKEWVVS